MKIVVCGDSYCSSHNYEREHFSQILEDNYGHEVINLARGGCSTVNICFQIQTAIELKPEVIIHGQTSPGRIELPVNNGKFNPGLGLKNFVYPFPDETSYGSEYVGDTTVSMFSDLMHGLSEQDDPKENDTLDRFIKILPEQRKAVKMYISYIYNHELKTITDQWMYRYWEDQIIKNNIQSIPFLPTNFAKVAYEFSTKTNGSYPKCYHTDYPTQLAIAEEIQSLIIKNNGCVPN